MVKNKQDKLFSQSNKKEHHEVCQVCLTQNPQEKVKNIRKQIDQERIRILKLHRCSSCKSFVHKNCYDPSLTDTNNWKCDYCKHSASKNSKQQCFICKCQGKMLKYVQDNKYVHIHCGLASEMLILQNFKTMKFKLNNESKQKQQIPSKREKQIFQGKKCTYCKKSSQQSLFKCYHKQCSFYSHITCHLKNKLEHEEDDNDIIYNLLNQTMGSFRLKNNEFIIKNQQSLKMMEVLDKPKRTINYMTCGPHSSECKWCVVCYKIDNPMDMVICDRCYRWVHINCNTMKNKSQNSYLQCNACLNNQIYLQRALFPQQIHRLAKLQTSQSKWTYESIKYMDSFAFKCSSQIYSQILTKNKYEVQYYFLYNFLEKQYLKGFDTKNQKQKKYQPVQKILERITANASFYLKDFNTKKIIEILYYLKHRQIKTRNQITTPDQINQLRSVYPKNQKKNNVKDNVQRVSQQQKCKKILNKLLDLYIKNLKKVDLKDISMKLIQFGQKIRKQVHFIKDTNNLELEMKKNKKNQKIQTVLQNLKKKPYKLAMDLRELLKMLSQNKQKLRGKLDIDFNIEDQNNQLDANVKDKSPRIHKSNPVQYNNFLMTIINCILSKDQKFDQQYIDIEDLQDLIDSYRKVVYVSRASKKRPQNKFILSDEEYYKIMNKSYDVNKTQLSDQSKVKISKFFKSFIKENNIKDSSQIKAQLTERYDQLIQQDKLNYKQYMALRQNIAEQGLFVDRHCKLLNLQKRATYFRVLKIKYMKLVRLELNSQDINDSFPLRVSEKNRKEIVDNVKRLLDANEKSIKLKEEQKSTLEYFLVKQQVFTNILKEQMVLGNRLDAYNPQRINQNNIQLEDEQNMKRNSQNQGRNEIDQTKIKSQLQLTVLQRLKRIFSFWINNTLQNPYHVIKILYPIAQKRIKFSLDYQTAFNQLIQSIGTRMNYLLKSQNSYTYGTTHHRVNSDQFTKLWKLVQYAQLQNAFQKLKSVHQQYSEWVRDFQYRYNPISKTLQDKFLNQQLLEVIDRKISQAERLQIDLKSQIKKLKMVKLWAVLSQKYIKDFQKKPTINAIQQFKVLMIKVQYPHNSIYQQVVELQNYGKQLNQRIQKYLKRPKFQDSEYYEQLYLINAKMTLKQAEQLKNQLQNSKLDVSAQLQTLQEEISSFMQIPSKIQHLLKKQDNLEQLIKIKTKILDAPIKYQNLQAYCQLYHRISYLKCITLQSNVNKKQFMRLLNTSQLGSIILTDKMPLLLKAYRDIQKAQKQSLSIKPKFENLLPVDNKKLKLQLSNDPTTLQSIQKIYSKVQTLRQKFKQFIQNKQTYQRYLVLENEISRYPVNYKDIQNQINRMKKQIDILVDRAMMIKKNFNPKQACEIVRIYGKIGMKHSELQSIKKIYQSYSICIQLSSDQQDYIEFAHKCKQYIELQGVMSLNQMRSRLFAQYSEQILQQKADAIQQNKNMNLAKLRALVSQGSYLLKHARNNTSVAIKQLQTLLKLNRKIQEITKPNSNKIKKSKKISNGEQNQDQYGDQYDSGQFDEEGSDQYGDGYDDQEEQIDYDDDQDQMDYDYDDDDQDESPQPPKKRAQPLVMEISDQDNEPEPEPRKIVHAAPIPASQRQNNPNEIIEESQQIRNISASQK